MFTQSELELAYEQMVRDRQNDYAEAVRWANELAQRIHHTVHVEMEGAPEISPYPNVYKLLVKLSKYDDWNKCCLDLEAMGICVTRKKRDVQKVIEGMWSRGNRTYQILLDECELPDCRW